MAYFEYEGRNISSFEEFRMAKEDERRQNKNNKFSIPSSYPSAIRRIAENHSELRDYLEFIGRGGKESPEQMQSILSRCSETAKTEKR